MLTDVGGKKFVPMEVFGMNTEDYNARKVIKTEIYKREYGEEGC